MPSFDSSKPFSQEGYNLMAAAFEVHNVLGGGLSEVIYQQSLEVELSDRGIPFRSREHLQVFYKRRILEASFQPDLLVYDAVLVELKAVSALLPEHEAQLFNYLRITRRPVGYLINLAPIAKVEWKRFVLSEYLDKSGDAESQDGFADR